MARRRTYFISDVHLGASYISDPRAHEGRVVAFLRSIEDDAAALYMLGDILDYWFEYRNVVPRGYIRFFGQLARMADAGVRIVWLTGNHDIWLFDYLRDEIGIEVISTPYIIRQIDGIEFYMAHGDVFADPPVSYRILRAIFHSRFCQKLYSGIHPRWTMPFAHGWSSHSRKGQSSPAKPKKLQQGSALLMQAAQRMSAENPDLQYIVIGHYHIALDEAVGENCRLVVLGNWIHKSTYAVFDGEHLELREWTE